MHIFLSFTLLLNCYFCPHAELDGAITKSGTERIQAIVAEHIHAVVPVINGASYARTNNGFSDLHIPQIAQVFNCKTAIGNSMLTHALEHPCTMDVGAGREIVEHRRDAIMLLSSNALLKEKFDILLEQARQAEQEVLELFSVHFKNRTCPELVALHRLKEEGSWLEPVSRFLISNPIARTALTCSTIGMGVGCAASTGICAYSTYTAFMAGRSVLEPALSSAYFGALSAWQSYNFYTDYANAAEKRYKVHALNKLVTVVQELELLCAAYGIVQQYPSVAVGVAGSGSLIQKIKSSRYEHKDTKLFVPSLVHSFLYTLYENDKQLAGILSALGELDYLNAIATTVMSSKERVNTFCFVRFVQQEKPLVMLKRFWNLLILNPVVNHFDEQCNVILTGPNAGGKTSSIKAILQAIMLAQTFGIAPAQEMTLTPFAIIHSYLNISDDLLKGESLFKAEINRAKEIMQTIKNMPLGHKYFFALDELFTGTNGEDGELCAYNFMLALSKYDSIQFIYATHFNKLKELGAAQRCALYKIDAPTKDEYGKFVYPYTISKGASTARIALDLAHEAGIF